MTTIGKETGPKNIPPCPIIGKVCEKYVPGEGCDGSCGVKLAENRLAYAGFPRDEVVKGFTPGEDIIKLG